MLRSVYFLSAGVILLSAVAAFADQMPIKIAPISVPPAVAEMPAVKKARWRYSSKVDVLRKYIAHQASLDSDNQLTFAFPYDGGSRASLLLQRIDNRPPVAVISISKGQFDCSGHCRIHVRFDQVTAEFDVQPPPYGPTDALILSAADSRNFIDRIAKVQKVTVNAAFYGAGMRQLAFSVAGLDWK